LIRVEDEAGKAMRNDYTSRDAGCGGGSERSDKGPEADLSAADRVRVLATLVWLAGRRKEPVPRAVDETSPWDRSMIEEYKAVKDLLAKTTRVAKLKERAAAKDPWVSEQAALAFTLTRK